MDDVIAEIMEDEADGGIARHADGSMTVPGDTPLSDLREALDEPAFDHDDAVTIAGLLLAIAGEVPEVGDVVSHGEYELTVEARESRKITSVGIRHL